MLPYGLGEAIVKDQAATKAGGDVTWGHLGDMEEASVALESAAGWLKQEAGVVQGVDRILATLRKAKTDLDAIRDKERARLNAARPPRG